MLIVKNRCETVRCDKRGKCNRTFISGIVQHGSWVSVKCKKGGEIFDHKIFYPLMETAERVSPGA